MADQTKKGTGKKPKGSGRRLYTDENPRDTVRSKFATPTDARKTVAEVNVGTLQKKTNSHKEAKSKRREDPETTV